MMQIFVKSEVGTPMYGSEFPYQTALVCKETPILTVHDVITWFEPDWTEQFEESWGHVKRGQIYTSQSGQNEILCLYNSDNEFLSNV